MIAQWNAPISDRFSSLCARVFSPAAAILENEKTLGTRLRFNSEKTEKNEFDLRRSRKVPQASVKLIF